MRSANTLCASLLMIITLLHSGHTSAQAPNPLAAQSRFNIAAQPASNFELRLYWSPAASPSAPTIIALHGCGGLFDSRGRMQGRETAFIRRANDAGHHVLLVDSFTTRGEREICTTPVNRRLHRSGDRRPTALACQPRSPLGVCCVLSRLSPLCASLAGTAGTDAPVPG